MHVGQNLNMNPVFILHDILFNYILSKIKPQRKENHTEIWAKIEQLANFKIEKNIV